MADERVVSALYGIWHEVKLIRARLEADSAEAKKTDYRTIATDRVYGPLMPLQQGFDFDIPEGMDVEKVRAAFEEYIKTLPKSEIDGLKGAQG